MNHYFYLDGDEQKGPFTIEELKSKLLTTETYIWTDDLDDWIKLKELPELAQQLNSKKIPYPPPFNKNNKIEVYGKIELIKNKSPNLAFSSLKLSNRKIKIYGIWTVFHLFALLSSYSQMDLFNNKGAPRSEEFWPFVNFYYCNDIVKWNQSEMKPYDPNFPDRPRVAPQIYGNKVGEKCFLNGLFIEYDFTEFAFYIGGAILSIIFQKKSQKLESNI